MVPQDYLLSDEQMRQFISHGYVVLKTDFPEGFHQKLRTKFEDVVDKEGNPGNNALPRVPEMQEVFKHPTIRGALTSVLGENHIMHPHRHCHFSRPGRTDQTWHQDSYWGYRKVRNHHNWWAMIFYYPQETTMEMGPSGLIPGTQYYTQRLPESIESTTQLLGEPGTFALIHYDLWHRGTSNVSEQNRTMMKFQFVRMDKPTAPAWNHQGAEWIPMNGDAPPTTHETIWRHQWDWHSGQRAAMSKNKAANGDVSHLIKGLKSTDPAERLVAVDGLGLLGDQAAEAIPELTDALRDRVDAVSVGAGYALAAMGDAGVPALLDAVRTTNKKATRNAGYALSEAGHLAISGLIDTASHEYELGRGYAAFALGELGNVAQEAVPALIRQLDDPSAWVRRNASEALGLIKTPAAQITSALAKSVTDDEDGQVRFHAALSLIRMGESAEAAVPALTEALQDENRYVRAYAVEGLRQINTPKSLSVALDYLMDSRWCPTTTPENSF